jgi:hypothetical protein
MTSAGIIPGRKLKVGGTLVYAPMMGWLSLQEATRTDDFSAKSLIEGVAPYNG